MSDIPFPVHRRRFLHTVGVVATATVTGCTSVTNEVESTTSPVAIDVTPIDGLIDDPLDVTVSGLPPEQNVTVWARVEDDNDQTWLSYATFESSPTGTIDLNEQVAVDGTYEGVDPMGLIWSMQVTEEVQVPWLQAESYTVKINAQVGDEVVDSVEVTRRIKSPTVAVEEVDDAGIVGLFFKPTNADPTPAVIALHGSDGQIPLLEGTMLASRGFATLSLQYFSPDGRGDLPTNLVRIPLEYFKRAMDWVLEHPATEGDQVGVLGSSKGGELALLLGTTFSEVGCVIGYIPAGIVFEGLDGEGSSWTYRGEEIPYVPLSYSGELVKEVLNGFRGRPLAFEPTYRKPLEEPDSQMVQEAVIPAEEIDGPVLLISGEDDQVWQSTPLSEITIDRLDRHGHAYPYDHLAYEDAGHMITIPYQPTSHFDAVPFSPGIMMAGGGTPPGNAHAAADSWPKVLEYLKEGLG